MSVRKTLLFATVLAASAIAAMASAQEKIKVAIGQRQVWDSQVIPLGIEAGSAEREHDDTDQDHQEPRRHDLAHPAGERRRDGAAHHQAGRDREVGEAEIDQERYRDRDRDEELGEIHAADRVARRMPARDER